ncbi:MAG: hypothetical protein IID40_10870 [Planctomycetes bacterium]|nr:hypothetical protein [Planctomycetota bacterium]
MTAGDFNAAVAGGDAVTTMTASTQVRPNNCPTSFITVTTSYQTTSTIGDCNQNGVVDDCDIADGVSLDCNEDAVPDDCQPIGSGDFDADGSVGLPDFAAFVACAAGPGQSPTPPVPDCLDACLAAFDFDIDDDVDLWDYAAFQALFGT